jgi:hypothetical protein
MDKVRKSDISVCYTPSSEPYSIYLKYVCLRIKILTPFRVIFILKRCVQLSEYNEKFVARVSLLIYFLTYSLFYSLTPKDCSSSIQVCRVSSD